MRGEQPGSKTPAHFELLTPVEFAERLKVPMTWVVTSATTPRGGRTLRRAPVKGNVDIAATSITGTSAMALRRSASAAGSCEASSEWPCAPISVRRGTRRVRRMTFPSASRARVYVPNG
jgi:hypothetical protein